MSSEPLSSVLYRLQKAEAQAERIDTLRTDLKALAGACGVEGPTLTRPCRRQITGPEATPQSPRDQLVMVALCGSEETAEKFQSAVLATWVGITAVQAREQVTVRANLGRPRDSADYWDREALRREVRTRLNGGDS